MPHLNPSDKNQYGGEWSNQKLCCVENYLRSYLTVMRDQSFDLWYIDAFSGDGIQRFNTCVDEADSIADEEDAELQRFTIGSALRAVSVSSEIEAAGHKGFDHFIFIEYNNEKLDELRNRIGLLFPDQIDRCEFVIGDVNEKLPLIIDSIPWATSARGVCFIDPWATQLSWATLQKASYSKCDFWLLFPIESINRLMPRNGYPPESWQRLLRRLYGDDGWTERYNFSGEQLNLFSEPEEMIWRTSGCQWLIEYTGERLRTVFPGVSKPGILKREDGVPKFVLYALVANPTERARVIALRIANYLIKDLNQAS